LIYSLNKNEYRNLKLAETIIRNGLSRMKKDRGDKQFGNIHGNITRKLMCRHIFISNKHVYFYFFSLSYKNQRTGGWNKSCPGVWEGFGGEALVVMGGGRYQRKGVGG
jgi:hypothetical protein